MLTTLFITVTNAVRFLHLAKVQTPALKLMVSFNSCTLYVGGEHIKVNLHNYVGGHII